MADDLRAVNPRARLFQVILSVYGIGIYIFLFAPIAVLVLLSFNASNVVGFPIAGFTTDWYARLPHDAVILKALGRTLLVAFWIAATSKPKCSANRWSSAAITASGACGAIRSQPTHE